MLKLTSPLVARVVEMSLRPRAGIVCSLFQFIGVKVRVLLTPPVPGPIFVL